MKTYEIVFTVVLAVMAVYYIIADVRLILVLKKAGKKTMAFKSDCFGELFCLIFGVTICFLHSNMILASIAALCTVVLLPMIPTYITSQGMPRVGLKAFMEPAEKISYEYAQGDLVKENLLIYRNGSEVPIKLHFGIKSPKLITILNDNYVKHGYENPLLKEQ
ncbi:hypothetical protein [Ruminococcus albus]|uniref:Conserved domain protein n=1 Tax=Ruminococcus albus 8 TaxID=246199 RepID=E9SA24_RUMAL|nr:hypothetical protein [Ruminococcus albus]EGC03875.1 conserved domain protein [Ruminococcus albus 8]MCC3350497.1 hypothetical protein [Ruminococcus albus 8]